MATRKPKIQTKRRRPSQVADDFVNSTKASTSEQKPKARVKESSQVRLTVDLPEELYMKLKLESVKQRRTMVALVREMLNEGLE